jgi:hypothetical protein
MNTILFISFIVNAILLIYAIFIKPKTLVPTGLMNFEQDSQFLMYLIMHKLNQTEKFFLEPSQASKSMFIDDEDFRKYQEQIVSSVLLSLSPVYRLTLAKYLTTKALYEYVAEVILRELSLKCVNMNLKHFYSSIKQPSDKLPKTNYGLLAAEETQAPSTSAQSV